MAPALRLHVPSCSVAGLLLTMLQAVSSFVPCSTPGASKGTSIGSSGKSLTWLPRADSKLWDANREASVLPIGINMDAVRVRELEEAQAGEGSRNRFVELFRDTTPYIKAHMGSVMVLHIPGEVLESSPTTMEDIHVLQLLGVSRKITPPPCIL